MGKLMYFGKRREMLPYFAFIEYPCPAYKNPADYYRKLFIFLSYFCKSKYEVLTMISKILLISMRKLMYFGKRREMLPYFAFIEYPCPAYKNPADYYRKLFIFLSYFCKTNYEIWNTDHDFKNFAHIHGETYVFR